MVADDLGYGDLAVYGHPAVQTPNLDRMAEEGVRLTNFYATPTCTPTRAALLTGRYPIRSGLIRVLHPGEKYGISDSEVTLAEALKELGYTTACIGKWHLGGLPQYRPMRHGFDSYYGLLFSNDMNLWPPDVRRLRLWRNDKPIEWPVNQSTLTKRYTEQAIAFIEESKDRPFFLYLPHTFPHVPLHVSREFRGKSKRGLYGDVVEELDWSAGEILRTLEALDLDESTLVVFTSDNGPALGKRRRGGSAGALRGGKRTTWEGGVRVPFIARWPEHIPAGRIEHGIASVLDLFPTLIETAGGRTPADRPIDGKNVMELLQGKVRSPHSGYFYYGGQEIYAVRSGEWKLHFLKRETGPGGPKEPQKCDPPELYNLNEDPSEQSNVARSHPEVVARLKALASEFRANVKPGKLLPQWRPLR
jgi:arylsulfatase A-like enzyme